MKKLSFKLLKLMSISSIALTMGAFFNSASAQTGFLQIPVDCEFNKTCYIQKYADAVKGPDYKDYNCGTLTNDDHKGTDFRLNDYVQLEQGVDVLAAVDGKVIETRDYMPDVNAKLVGKESVFNRGYGNMIVLQHKNNYRTVYAHLKRNSIKVKIGDIVKAGTPMGQIGLSGLTEYPHLHFEILKGNQRLDPFTGDSVKTSCGQSEDKSLWAVDLPYKPVHLVGIGMFSNRLSIHAMEHKLYENARLRPSAKGMILNAYIAGVRKGDKVHVKIYHNDAAEPFYDQEAIREKDLAFELISAGRKNKGKNWPKGIYRGEITYSRIIDGKPTILIEESAETEIK
ncbi:M23 family metallopeptidase [Curvivirga aplysinae]|uniref:M23 family metallopeptidase n=1 Tax=Curvivirga aplysinae TaxID=2529852 RepID=UPI0012BC50C3|nr:M23 family metallopeptidase [Curvivirga aplysinae]MTI10529.1 M23 family metallopeptidase [Curvivirga aplysinae]